MQISCRLVIHVYLSYTHYQHVHLAHHEMPSGHTERFVDPTHGTSMCGDAHVCLSAQI